MTVVLAALSVLVGGAGLAALTGADEAPSGIALVGVARADASAPAAASAAPAPVNGADVIVARVGDAVITAAELERRVAQVPRPTLAAFGSTPAEIRKNFLDKVIIRDALFAEEAKSRGQDREKDVRDRLLGVLRSALLDELRAKSGVKAGISDEEVAEYYKSNIDKFVAPKRVGVARILVDSEAEARALLTELGEGEVDMKKWNDLARDKSLDKSTSMRGGNLGMVAEDGSTAQPDKRVAPGVFAAADKVKDGELVREPVREGTKWAVILKRQTMRAITRPLDAVGPDIRNTIADDKMRSAVQSLLESLRTELVHESNPQLCDMVSVGSTGDLEKAERPGVLPRTRTPARPAPEQGPAGQR